MNPKIFVTAIALTIILIGCGSFNNSFNHYTIPVQPKEETPPPANLPLGPDDDERPVSKKPSATGSSGKTSDEKSIPNCDVSPYPTPGHPPELPIKELQAAGGDVYEVERIERSHIDDLRAYIMLRRRLQREAKEVFNEKCDTVGKY